MHVWATPSLKLAVKKKLRHCLDTPRQGEVTNFWLIHREIGVPLFGEKTGFFINTPFHLDFAGDHMPYVQVVFSCYNLCTDFSGKIPQQASSALIRRCFLPGYPHGFLWQLGKMGGLGEPPNF